MSICFFYALRISSAANLLQEILPDRSSGDPGRLIKFFYESNYYKDVLTTRSIFLTYFQTLRQGPFLSRSSDPLLFDVLSDPSKRPISNPGERFLAHFFSSNSLKTCDFRGV